MTSGFACKHVCDGEAVQRAVRDVPLHETDSGWSLRCARHTHGSEEYRLVALESFLRQDRSLAEVLKHCLYTVVYRDSEDQKWKVEAQGIPPGMQN